MSYRDIDFLAEPPPHPTIPHVGMDKGFSGHLPAEVADLGSFSELDGLRFQGRAVRKDFGYRPIGTAASTRIYGLIEHKFIRTDASFQRLVRLRVNGSMNMVLEVWSSGAWVTVETTAETVNRVLFSAVSMLGVLLISEGSNIFIWEETATPDSGEQDFPAGNLLDAVGESTSITINPGNATGSYLVHFDATVVGASQGGISLVLAIDHEGEEVATKTLLSAASTDQDFTQTFSNEPFSFDRSIANGEDIALRIKSITIIGVTRQLVFTADGSDRVSSMPYRALPQGGSYNLLYSVNFNQDSNIMGGDAAMDVQLLVNEIVVDTWRVARAMGTPALVIGATRPITDSIPEGATIRLHAEQAYGTTSPSMIEGELYWQEASNSATAEVHGHNLADDADPNYGISYPIETSPISVFEPVGGGAPAARFIAQFGDYLLALRDGADLQSLAWCANGDVREWTLVDSGQITPQSLSDPVDALMGFAALSNQLGALFRQRSIARVFLTGNVVQSIGVASWLEGIGTESPFSIQAVKGGILFLGHDMMVYYLTESSLQPVGAPIQQELIQNLTSNLDAADSAFDTVFSEYILGVPENNSTSVTKLWYFDLSRFLATGETIWRARSQSVQRLAVVSQI